MVAEPQLLQPEAEVEVELQPELTALQQPANYSTLEVV
jgi:hypothetical protein